MVTVCSYAVNSNHIAERKILEQLVGELYFGCYFRK